LTGWPICYVAAIPFFGWTIAGDLVYTGVLFGLHAWLSRTVASRKRVNRRCLKRVALSGSSGKDSAWSLHLLKQNPESKLSHS